MMSTSLEILVYNGFGLTHIKNNVEALEGQFSVDKSDGFKVTIVLPIT